MPVRHVKREEMLEFSKIQTIAFVGSMNIEERKRELAEQEEPRYCIANYNEDGTMLAGMVLPEYSIMYDGHFVKMVGVGGVVSLPEYRYGGAVRACFDYAFKEMRKGGAVFSALYPFSHAYYRKFGYELSEPVIEYKFPIDALKGYRHTGFAKMHTQGESLDDYKRIFKAFYHRYNASIERTEEHWKRSRLARDPYKDRTFSYLLDDEKGANAYITLSAERNEEHSYTAVVHELAYTCKDAFYGILGFLYRFAAQYSEIKMILPSDIPLLALADESYEISISYKQQPMFRIMDACEALSLMRNPGNIRYTARVVDEAIAENDGVFLVESTEGKSSVTRLSADAPHDFSVNIRTLTQMCLGYLDFGAACMKQDVSVYGNEEVLRAVFTRKETFLTDYF